MHRSHRSCLNPVLAVLGLCLIALLLAPPLAAEGEEERRIRLEKVLTGWADGESDHDGSFQIRVLGGDDALRAKVLKLHLDDKELWGHRLAGGGGFLGVRLTELTPELRAHFGVTADRGVMVARVADGSPAQQAGLEVGDIIANIDGEPVESASALSRAVRGRQGGDSVDLELYRDGQLRVVSATLEEQADSAMNVRAFFLNCGDDGENCDFHLGQGDLLCQGEAGCSVEINCSDGDCSCIVNGEEQACTELHRLALGD